MPSFADAFDDDSDDAALLEPEPVQVQEVSTLPHTSCAFIVLATNILSLELDLSVGSACQSLWFLRVLFHKGSKVSGSWASIDGVKLKRVGLF